MPAIVMAAWAWIVPWAGPALKWGVQRLPWLPGLGTLRRWARVGSYLAALGGGIWLGVQVLAWWEGEKLTERQAKAKAAAAIARANLEAKETALAARERALAERERAIAADAAELDKLEQELSDARGNSASGGGVALRGDDEWLRQWTVRRR